LAARRAYFDGEEAWKEIDHELNDMDRAILSAPLSDIGLKARIAVSLERDSGWNHWESFHPQMRVFCEQLVAWRGGVEV
jgi:hypothetical protein